MKKYVSYQVSTVVHDLEQKRAVCLKVEERLKKEKEKGGKSAALKSANQLEKEKTDSKYKTSKVEYS